MTEKLGSPPVEGLSDVAWARVERNVFSRVAEGTVTSAAASREVRRTERTANKWLWLAVPGAAAAAFALAFFSMNGPSAPQQVAQQEPSRIVAGAAPSRVSFADAHITVDANSAVVMDPSAGKPTALLENGAAVFAVPPRGDRAPFTVLAGDASIRTSNAQFRVSREGERATVTVDTGSVDIRFRGREFHVGSKHTWSSEEAQQAR
ncbi:MAG TPA: FecR domain-containing protein [Kofleriaceae bacterium]